MLLAQDVPPLLASLFVGDMKFFIPVEKALTGAFQWAFVRVTLQRKFRV